MVHALIGSACAPGRRRAAIRKNVFGDGPQDGPEEGRDEKENKGDRPSVNEEHHTAHAKEPVRYPFCRAIAKPQKPMMYHAMAKVNPIASPISLLSPRRRVIQSAA